MYRSDEIYTAEHHRVVDEKFALERKIKEVSQTIAEIEISLASQEESTKKASLEVG